MRFLPIVFGVIGVIGLICLIIGLSKKRDNLSIVGTVLMSVVVVACVVMLLGGTSSHKYRVCYTSDEKLVLIDDHSGETVVVHIDRCAHEDGIEKDDIVRVVNGPLEPIYVGLAEHVVVEGTSVDDNTPADSP